jgi:hypothetical protein
MDRQAIYVPTGSVFLMGSITLAVTRPIGGPWLLLIVVPLALLGAYIVVAPFVGWGLPGDKAREEMGKREKSARKLLNEYYQASDIARRNTNVTTRQFVLFQGHLMLFVSDAWGFEESAWLINGEWASPQEAFEDTREAIRDFESRIPRMTLDSTFDSTKVVDPKWLLIEISESAQ